MPSRSAASTNLRLSELEGFSDDQYVDVCLVFRRRLTGEKLLEVGGRWDRINRCYVGEARRRHVVLVNEAQLDLCAALRSYLEKRLRGLDREVLQFAGVKRGGGKTHWFVLALAAIAIALPGAVTWAVSPTHQKRDEIDRILRSQLPPALGWWIWKGQPDFRFTYITGSILRLLSGEIPETVKQGGFEAALINEAQDQARSVYSMAQPGVRNVEGRPAGILFIAANPPLRVRGEWVNELAEKLMAGEVDGRYFDVKPEDNASIEQAAQDKASRNVEAIDPRAAMTDLGGQWLPVGDRAFPLWRSREKDYEGASIGLPPGLVRLPSLVGHLPDLGYTDITVQALREIGIYRSSDRAPYEWVIIADFQGRPHMAATVGKVFRGPDGKRHYWIAEEVIVKGDEHDLSDALEEAGYSPDTAAIVGDASGDWQSGKDRRRRLPSWDVLKSHRWLLVGPRDKIREGSKHPSNPPVDRSLTEVYVVMRESRLLVDPGCTWAITALEKCPLKKDGQRVVIPSTGDFSHVCDTVRYFIHRFEPKSKVKRLGGGPRGASFPEMRPGANFKM